MKVVEIAEAAGQLASLVADAEHGEDVVLTRDGRSIVRLTPAPEVVDRRQGVAAIMAEGAAIREAIRDDLLARGQPLFTIEEIMDLIRSGRDH